MELASRGADVDVALEGFTRGRLTHDVGQAADAAPLGSEGLRLADKGRDRSLQGTDAVLQRQRRVLAQGGRRSFHSSRQYS
jgi:hypothetical protein